MQTQQTVVESPCIRQCGIDEEKGHCRGCFRTLSEIAQWSQMPNERKLEVIEAAGQRCFAEA